MDFAVERKAKSYVDIVNKNDKKYGQGGYGVIKSG
jgi:hypothetical protein